MVGKAATLTLLLQLCFVREIQPIGNAIFGANFSLPFWCYSDPDCDESTWISECHTGFQSPIDLPPLTMVAGKHETVHFPSSQLFFPNFELDYRGLAIQVKPGGDPFSFQRKPKETGKEITYNLHSLDFHWGSDMNRGAEHSIDGLYYEAEVHLLFYNVALFDPETANEIPKYKEQKDFLVITIFLDVEHLGWKPTSYFFDPIAINLKRLSEYEPIEVTTPLNLTGLFRGSVAYKYLGSFTSPNCREIEWWILRKPVVIPKRHINAMRNALVDGELIRSDNFRSNQGPAIEDITLLKLKYDI